MYLTMHILHMLMLLHVIKISMFLNVVCLGDLITRVFNVANFFTIAINAKPLNKAAAIIFLKLILTLNTFMN